MKQYCTDSTVLTIYGNHNIYFTICITAVAAWNDLLHDLLRALPRHACCIRALNWLWPWQKTRVFVQSLSYVPYPTHFSSISSAKKALWVQLVGGCQLDIKSTFAARKKTVRSRSAESSSQSAVEKKNSLGSRIVALGLMCKDTKEREKMQIGKMSRGQCIIYCMCQRLWLSLYGVSFDTKYL